MKYALLVVALAAIVLAPGGGTPAQDRVEAGSSATVILKKAAPPAGHDVWELRVVLLTPKTAPAAGIDLRLRQVLGGEAADGRFFTVSAEPDPETLVTNLGKLGTIEILDRANLPVAEKHVASYRSGTRIPVPQVETRTANGQPNTFERMKFEELGTKMQLARGGKGLEGNLEASFLLGVTEPYGYPIIAHASWKTVLDVPVGRTAVLRSHYMIPGALLGIGGARMDRGADAEVPGAPKGSGNRVPVVRSDLGRVLVVLLTHSQLQ